jgi:hypothetical protein
MHGMKNEYSEASNAFITRNQDQTVANVEQNNKVSEHDIKKIVNKELINLEKLAFAGAIIGFIGAWILWF